MNFKKMCLKFTHSEKNKNYLGFFACMSPFKFFFILFLILYVYVYIGWVLIRVITRFYALACSGAGFHDT